MNGGARRTTALPRCPPQSSTVSCSPLPPALPHIRPADTRAGYVGPRWYPGHGTAVGWGLRTHSPQASLPSPHFHLLLSLPLIAWEAHLVRSKCVQTALCLPSSLRPEGEAQIQERSKGLRD